MAYIGAQPNKQLTETTSQSFNGTGSATAFTLNRAVNTGEELEVFVDNVQQEPGSGKSYTATGTTLTFDEAPPLGTGNVYVIYRGQAEVTTRLEAPDLSITSAKLADDAVTKAKIGATELDLATIKDSSGTNTAMTIDSSGRVLFPQIPCACVTLTTSNTQDTSNPYTTTGTAILFDKVSLNQGSVYDSSNGRFTAPVAGIYEFAYSYLKDDDSGANVTYVNLFKNGSAYTGAGGTAYDENPGDYAQVSQKLLIDLAANDYLTLQLMGGGIHLNSSGQYHSIVFKLVG